MLAQTIFALRSISSEIRFRIYFQHVGPARGLLFVSASRPRSVHPALTCCAMHFDACKQDSVFDRYPKHFMALLTRVPSAFGDAYINSVHLRCNNGTLTEPDLHAREKLTAAFLGRIELARVILAVIK